MKFMSTLPAAAISAALILAACSEGEATAQAEDSESAAEDASEETPEVHDAAGYAEDETGGLIDAAIVEELNTKLLSYHASSGRDVHVVLGMSTDGRDVEEVAEEMRAERDADALIYVAGSDQALAIVGEALGDTAVGEAELAMIAHFEENELSEGLNAGIDAVIADLGQ
ncbi:hypothetical protein HFP51_12685 [Parasphingopyxis sp. CP4]|uniref:TPM domain-containing protein n=1 Tax=Parasphingopyxis sp. CP4 TaxID=2724527 RepID=UPI0015A40B95|nr:TPM domain-containing protein [Parasphingopyxis sp. CP4]QLC22966.1 hypothetical protein HFP51_12685 [Parasphingopyxis sp. CP4]